MSGGRARYSAAIRAGYSPLTGHTTVKSCSRLDSCLQVFSLGNILFSVSTMPRGFKSRRKNLSKSMYHLSIANQGTFLSQSKHKSKTSSANTYILYITLSDNKYGLSGMLHSNMCPFLYLLILFPF